MFRPSVFFVLATLLAILASSCNFYHAKEDAGDLNTLMRHPSYNGIRQAVLTPKCIACHNSNNASGGLAFDSYQLVLQNIQQIEQAALIDKIMPPSAPLSDQEQAALRAWISAGLPEQTTEPTPPPPVLEATFTSIRKNIFEMKCISCHSTGGSAEKVSLVRYEDIMNSPREIIVPQDPTSSGLVIAIERQDEKRMPPPKSGLSALSATEILTIRQWISDGAKDN
jgi:uncharacterized membrane protein